jgi:DNA-binding NarL/FixJ family response regulator
LLLNNDTGWSLCNYLVGQVFKMVVVKMREIAAMARVPFMAVVRVLVADDVEGWRRLVSSILRTEPFEIICEASDGLMAIQLAERLQPTIVLLDIGLPRANGISVGREIRKLAPQTKVVFVSQESDHDIVSAALKLGACGYVLKLDAAQELVAAIHSVIRGKKFVSSSLARHAFFDDVENERPSSE